MDTPVLMPEPNFLRYAAGFVTVRNGERAGLTDGVARLYPEILDVCDRKLGLRLARSSDWGGAAMRFRLLDADDRRRIRETFGFDCGSGCPRPEAYLIWADSQGITVSAADKRGFFYALQTLRQLGGAADGGGFRERTFKPAVVFDYPHARLRGVHVYLPAREHLAYCRRFVDAIAALKYNRITFEVSGMEYKRHPEINEAWVEYSRDMDEYPEKAKTYQGGSHCAERPWYKDSIHLENAGGGFLLQEEVRDLVAYCTSNLLDVVPEVQSLSHCDYLVIPHREIAEMPHDPYPDSYCPSNPRSYELLFDVIDEVVEVFEPETVNIGHDEWYTAGYCPICRTKDAAELLAGDVARIRDYLDAKGIRTEMWGDKLLDAHTPDGRGQGGAYRIVENYSTSEIYNTLSATHGAVALIPKDVRIGNWYWAIEPGAFDEYARHGLQETVYANFSGPEVKDWEVFSRKENVYGASLSHWDLLEEANMAREGILTNIVYSSYPLWNESYTNASWERVRDRTLEFMPSFMQIVAGRALPGLSPAPKERVTGLVRHEKSHALYMDAAVIKLRTYVDTVIQHRDTGTYHRGARVAEVERAQSFRIAVLGGLVDSLVFRHNTSIRLAYRSADKGYRLADYLIGHYTVRYADGSREIIELHYGRNISSADVEWGRTSLPCTYSSSIELLQAACYARPWVKTLNNRDHVTVYDYEWANPHPERELEDVSLTLAEKGVAYSIFVYDVYGIRLLGGQARCPASA